MSRSAKDILLNINNGYTFFVSSMHMGLMTSLVLFFYPTWVGLTLENIHEHFSLPALLATKLFVILIPIMMVTASIMIITEWRTPLRWPAIIVLLGIIGSTAMAKYFLFPINDIIAAGVKTQAELTALLKRWLVLNNWRVFFSVLTWLAVFTFYTLKIYRKTE